MNLIVVILVILAIAALLGGLGAGPGYPFSHGYGYWPGGVLGTVFVVVLILWLIGRIG